MLADAIGACRTRPRGGQGGLQYFLTPLLLAPGFLPALLSNLLYSVAFSYYHYTQFLGYNALPFLEHTELFLYPLSLIHI